MLMKNGYSVTITLDMFANIALPSFIIFSSMFGTKLLKEYKNMTKFTVLFIETHWMTSVSRQKSCSCI